MDPGPTGRNADPEASRVSEKFAAYKNPFTV